MQQTSRKARKRPRQSAAAADGTLINNIFHILFSRKISNNTCTFFFVVAFCFVFVVVDFIQCYQIWYLLLAFIKRQCFQKICHKSSLKRLAFLFFVSVPIYFYTILLHLVPKYLKIDDNEITRRSNVKCCLFDNTTPTTLEKSQHLIAKFSGKKWRHFVHKNGDFRICCIS